MSICYTKLSLFTNADTVPAKVCRVGGHPTDAEHLERQPAFLSYRERCRRAGAPMFIAHLDYCVVHGRADGLHDANGDELMLIELMDNFACAAALDDFEDMQGVSRIGHQEFTIRLEKEN